MIYEKVIFLADGGCPEGMFIVNDVNLSDAIKLIRRHNPRVNGVILVVFRNRYKFIGYLGDIVV